MIWGLWFLLRQQQYDLLALGYSSISENDILFFLRGLGVVVMTAFY